MKPTGWKFKSWKDVLAKKPKAEDGGEPRKKGGFRGKRAIGTLLLLCAVLTAFFAARQKNAVAGCRQRDLTPVPDTSFDPVAAQAAGGTQQEGEASPETAQPRLVCLTFDDGPSETTEKVLDVLKTEGVPATFFVIADENNRKYLPLLQREAEEGHEIALHSATHNYKIIYQNPESYWQDIKQLRETISDYVDVDAIHYLRFPGGSTNTVSHKYGGNAIMKRLKAQAKANGYHYVDWNVCADDAVGGHPSASKVMKNTLADVDHKAVCVVLMHDTKATKTTAEALPDIIAWFKENGFAFCTVQQLPTL